MASRDLTEDLIDTLKHERADLQAWAQHGWEKRQDTHQHAAEACRMKALPTNKPASRQVSRCTNAIRCSVPMPSDAVSNEEMESIHGIAIHNLYRCNHGSSSTDHLGTFSTTSSAGPQSIGIGAAIIVKMKVELGRCYFHSDAQCFSRIDGSHRDLHYTCNPHQPPRLHLLSPWQVEEMDLSLTLVGIRGLGLVLSLLPHLPHLRSLNVSNNSLDNTVLPALAEVPLLSCTQPQPRMKMQA